MPIKLSQFDSETNLEATDILYGSRPDRVSPREEMYITIDALVSYVEDNLDPLITRNQIDVYSTSEIDSNIATAKTEAQDFSTSEAIKFAIVLG